MHNTHRKDPGHNNTQREDPGHWALSTEKLGTDDEIRYLDPGREQCSTSGMNLFTRQQYTTRNTNEEH
jgi:hypothetical protein